jgi:hypothetical protein
MATYSYNFPVIITAQGLQPQTPASLLSQLTANVALTNPGYKNNLPGSLIEDVSSTDVAAIALCDQARVDLGNSLTPNAANEPLLLQIGATVGLPMGTPSFVNVGVQVSGTAGYVVTQGAIVSDGTYSYQTQAPVIVPTSGWSSTVLAIALNSSQSVVPAANTVTQLKTSVPSGYTVNVNNPAAGNPAQPPETFQSYRARVLQANLAASVGTGRYIKTLVGAVPGVTPRLIAVQQASGGGIRVIVGGSGDPYQVALAILQSVADPSQLVGHVAGGTTVTTNVVDYPDTYSIVSVMPAAQVVTSLVVTWNTSLTSFSGGGAFPTLTIAPLAAYINQLIVGQPMNLLEMQAIFQQAIAGVLDPNLLTRLVFSVYINGTLTPPATGYSDIPGDAESYFTVVPTAITVAQG